MKLPTSLALIIGSLFLAGCETEPRVGMTEKQFLRDAVYADDVYAQGSVKAYKSNRQYYYFRSGVLVKIDPGWVAPEKIEELNRPAAVVAPFDAYTELKKLDELRKNQIITEEEFQVQKKKILDRKE